jgi:hypothetical protein
VGPPPSKPAETETVGVQMRSERAIGTNDARQPRALVTEGRTSSWRATSVLGTPVPASPYGTPCRTSSAHLPGFGMGSRRSSALAFRFAVVVSAPAACSRCAHRSQVSMSAHSEASRHVARMTSVVNASTPKTSAATLSGFPHITALPTRRAFIADPHFTRLQKEGTGLACFGHEPMLSRLY